MVQFVYDYFSYFSNYSKNQRNSENSYHSFFLIEQSSTQKSLSIRKFYQQNCVRLTEDRINPPWMVQVI